MAHVLSTRHGGQKRPCLLEASHPVSGTGANRMCKHRTQCPPCGVGGVVRVGKGFGGDDAGVETEKGASLGPAGGMWTPV